MEPTPDWGPVAGELGDEQIGPARRGEIARAEIHRALRFAYQDDVVVAVDGDIPGVLFLCVCVTEVLAPGVVALVVELRQEHIIVSRGRQFATAEVGGLIEAARHDQVTGAVAHHGEVVHIGADLLAPLVVAVGIELAEEDVAAAPGVHQVVAAEVDRSRKCAGHPDAAIRVRGDGVRGAIACLPTEAIEPLQFATGIELGDECRGTQHVAATEVEARTPIVPATEEDVVGTVDRKRMTPGGAAGPVLGAPNVIPVAVELGQEHVVEPIRVCVQIVAPERNYPVEVSGEEDGARRVDGDILDVCVFTATSGRKETLAPLVRAGRIELGHEDGRERRVAAQVVPPEVDAALEVARDDDVAAGVGGHRGHQVKVAITEPLAPQMLAVEAGALAVAGGLAAVVGRIVAGGIGRARTFGAAQIAAFANAVAGGVAAHAVDAFAAGALAAAVAGFAEGERAAAASHPGGASLPAGRAGAAGALGAARVAAATSAGGGWDGGWGEILTACGECAHTEAQDKRTGAGRSYSFKHRSLFLEVILS